GFHPHFTQLPIGLQGLLALLENLKNVVGHDAFLCEYCIAANTTLANFFCIAKYFCLDCH
ncbi:MAG: hypothetical protein PVG58_10465, partial [Gammaproteobacteria bacterium]